MAEPFPSAQIPLAIVGMACRLPGADNLEEYWKLLVEGRSAVRELPPDRLDQELYYDPAVGVRGKTYCKLAAILNSRRFDSAACPISPALAASVDNAHLLMCEVAAAALRQGGMDPWNMPQRNVGVYVGHAQGSTLGGEYTYATCVEEAAHILDDVDDFRQLPPAHRRQVIQDLVEAVRGGLPRRTPESPDVAANLVAGTISKAFGLTGPFLAINSACASSLQAILCGARALQLGRIDMAIVGGASDCKSDSLVLFSHAQAMSSTGTRPFDADADGLICSEGYVALVLKTLERAVADGDPIQAVIRGLGVASDGKGKSLWAPRKEGQIEAMRRAYRSGLDMSRLQYIEAHATATQLGDATELNTLAEALGPVLPAGTKIPIASVKANIGHSLETAGLAGVLKVVLAMQRGTIPPAINVRSLNPKIKWDEVPYYVPMAATPWPAPSDGHPRRAAVNAFGIGGLNMHVVLDEYAPAAQQFYFSPPTSANSSAADSDAVAVIGRGCILPGAHNVPGFWQMLLEGRDPKCNVPDGRWRTDLFCEPGTRSAYRSPSALGGFVRDFVYDWRVHKVPPKQIAEADPLQFMLLDAADQALKEAGYDQRPFDRKRVGVLVGTEFGGDFSFQLQLGLRLPHLQQILTRLLNQVGLAPADRDRIFAKFSAALLKRWPALIDETGSFSTSSLASRISKTWDLMGGAAAVDAGSSSSLAVLGLAVDQLLAGDVDMMICAAGQRRMGLPSYEAMSLNGLLAAGAPPRARFDATAHGHVPGEGVAVVLLKRLSDARRDGDRVLAVIRGVGAGHAESAGGALRLAIERCCRTAAVDPADIAVMEAEGPAVPAERDDELQAILHVHGSQGRRLPLRLGSLVGHIGHLDGAAGMAALVKASLEIEHGESPGQLGLAQPAVAIQQQPRSIEMITERKQLVPSAASGRRVAAVSTVSRGLAYHAVLEYPVEVTPEADPTIELPTAVPSVHNPDWRIVRTSAATMAELALRAESLRGDCEATFAAAEKTRFSPADRFRLAVVVDSPASLAAKLTMLAGGQPGRKGSLDDEGIYVRERPTTRPRLALAFPGQGSQYVGMLSDLVHQSPFATAACEKAGVALAKYGFKKFGELAWTPSSNLGVDAWHTQAAMLLADHIMLATVAGLGLRPDLVFGHSYGEYAALLAAGAWSLETALAVTKARCDGIAACGTARGRLLAVAAGPDVVERLVRQSGAHVYLANHNSADQTVVAGRDADLEIFARQLRGESVGSQLLKVPCPFHSPLLAGATGPLQRELKNANIVSPRLPFFSVVTNDVVHDPETIRRNLIAHLTTPVRYVDLVERIVSAEPTVLLEVGPQQVLTKLHRRIVGQRSIECVSCDDSKHRGLVQLIRVRARLECLGVFDEGTAEQLTMVRQHTREILQFDATARRREKMRDGATRSPVSEPPGAISPTKPQPIKPTEPIETSVPLPAVSAPAAETAKAGSPTNGDLRERATSPAPARAPAGPGAEELEKFLIQFVVEQTGYPPEVVELDADLEADLGIDSIKKAQLFGELQEYFDVTPGENLTLDDFPTLRHVLNFLTGAAVKGELPSASAPSAPTNGSTAQAPTPSPGLTVDLSQRERRGAGPSAPASGASASELEKFLVQFVVEQTGYPPEVVELDADLEADLGIDSIKKAQLFGELQEYFDVTPGENLTLDDFPTLRHVLDFLAGASPSAPLQTAQLQATHSQANDTAALFETAAPEFLAAANPRVDSWSAVESRAPAAAVAPATATANEFVLVAELQGTPYEMGLALGRQYRQTIVRTLRRYADIAVSTPLDDEPLAMQPLPEGEWAELEGLADGANVPLANLTALNFGALGPVGGPTSTVVARSGAESNDVLLAIGVERPLSGAIRACFAPLIQLRKPSGGVPHALVTWLGGIGGLCGANGRCVAAIAEPAAGASSGAVSMAQIEAAQVVKAVLGAANDLTGAIQIAQGFRTIAPWGVCISHAGRSVRVTYDGREHRVTSVEPAANPGFTSAREFDNLLRNGTQATDQALAAIVDPAQSALWIKLAEDDQPGQWRPIALDKLASDRAAAVAPPAPQSQRAIPFGLAAEDPEADMSHRFVMRMVEAELPADAPTTVQWHGPALVIGDNPSADALRRALTVAGATVYDLPASGDLDATLGAFAKLWRQQPIAHLFLMSNRDHQPMRVNDDETWRRLRSRDVLVPFFLCQRWLQLAGEAQLLDRATLMVGTSLGGDFGFAGKMGSPTGGALTGLVKAIYIEYLVMRQLRGRMTAKAVDAPPDEPPDSLAANILRELASGARDYEVAYVGGRRRSQTAVHCPAKLADSADVRPGGVWVVTGGARGITAECARELGRRFGLRLHLIGASPQPASDANWRSLSADEVQALKARVMIEAANAGKKPAAAWEAIQKAIEIDRTLALFVADGIRATYHACDVSDRDALARTLDEIRSVDGPIEGILHGAGVDRSCRFERKNRDDVAATLGAKVDGAYSLMRLTRRDPLRHFISFGSISGRLGSNGQVDYGLASDLLCKLTTWFAAERPECRAIAWHWHPWDEVGMAYRPETRATFQMTDAPALMPKREGVAHLMRELVCPAHENEVLITDWDYYRRFYGDGPSADQIVKDPPPPSAAEIVAPTAPPKGIASRHNLRLVDAPLEPGAGDRPDITGPALILGENVAAWALAAKLESLGISARVLPTAGDVQTALAQFDRAWSAAPAASLFVMSARDPDAGQIWDEPGWRRRRSRGIDVPLAIIQRWLIALAALPERPPATILAAVDLGGEFGLSPGPFAPEGGALAGLLKSLYIENSRQSPSALRVKVLDAPAGEPPADLAAAICQELFVDTPAIEVAWSAGRRRVLQTVPAAGEPLVERDLSPGAWVVTGGARGITAAAALALGRRYGLRLHLIGKSPVPLADSPWRNATDEELKAIKGNIVRQAIAAGRSPEEDWNRVKKDIEIHESLGKFAAAGVHATYHSCDVADWAGLARVLEGIRQTDGPIEGIIHGAGYAKTARFESKDPKSIDQTFAAKVDGAVALLSLTRQDPLRYFVGFGSISGRFGGNGLADYAAANDMLAKLIAALGHWRPDCASACIDWQSWDEIGMAMLSDSVGITKSTLKMEFLSPAEGIDHLDRELRAGLPVREVAITDGFFQRTMYPHDFAADLGSAAPAEAQVAAVVRRPLIDGLENGADGTIIARLRLDPRSDPFLIHHRMRDKPFLPGVAGIEAIAEAAAAAEPKRKMGAIKNVEIVGGLAFHSGEPIDVRVTLSPTAGGYECSLTADLKDRKGRTIDARRACLRGIVEMADQAPQCTMPPPGDPPQGWFDYRYPDQSLVEHGSPFRCLVQCTYQYDGGWGRIVAPAAAELAGAHGAEGWILPVAVLDACVVACGAWAYLQFGGRLELPFGFDRLTPLREPRDGERCVVRFFYRGQDEKHTRFDFTLFGDDGTVVLDAVGYRTVMLADPGKEKPQS